ncbi:MAG: hypothetical protein V4556_07675 [Bacteroidota bacterium]
MRKVLLLTHFLLLSYCLFAQVNMQNGAAEQSFPLINFSDEKAGLNLGLGLSYSSGNGLLVNEIATNVGTGWSLEAGGAIVRIQNGLPDDQPSNGVLNSSNAYYHYDDNNGLKILESKYSPGYLYNSNAEKGCNVGKQYYPLFAKERGDGFLGGIFRKPYKDNVFKRFTEVDADVEQDKFIFHFGGRSGTFIIGRDWKITTLGDSRIKVDFTTSDMSSDGIRTTINKFIITTEDGLKYTFSSLNRTRLCQYKYSEFKNNTWKPIVGGKPGAGEMELNSFYGYPMSMDVKPFIVTAWNLSEIENTNNGEKIVFNYQTINTDFVSSKVVTHNRDLNKSSLINTNGLTGAAIKVSGFLASLGGFNASNVNGMGWYKLLRSNSKLAGDISKDPNKLNKLKAGSTMLVYGRSVSVTKRIVSITLPNNGNVTFNYDTKPRADLEGENALVGINYSIDGKLIRGYDLKYGYLYKNTIKAYDYTFSTYEKKLVRLCLLSIQKIGDASDNATEPPYQFNYITNTTSNKDDIVPPRNFLAQDHWGFYNGDNSQLPLDQDHDFFYEKTRKTDYFKTTLYWLKASKNLLAQNGLLKSVTYPTGGSISYTYSQNKVFNKGTNQEIYSGGVSVSQTVMFDGENHSKDIIKQYNYKNSGGESSRWGYEDPVYHSLSQNHYVLAATYKIYRYPGIEYPEMASNIDMSKILGKAILSGLIMAGIQGGIMALLPAQIVAGLNLVLTVYAVIKVIVEIVSATVNDTYTYTLTNQNQVSANPIGERFARVEVVSNSPNSYNGKTVYEYTSDKDVPLLRPTIAWPFSNAPRMIDWVYGLPKSEKVYNSSNQIINETYNGYNIYRRQGLINSINRNLAFAINTNNSNCNCNSQKSESVRQGNWGKYNYFIKTPKNDLTPIFYNYLTGRVDQTSTYQKSYNSQGQLYYEDRSAILTDPSTLLQKAKTIQKDPNSVITTINYYPKDYNISGAIFTLKGRNAIYTPVSMETWETKTLIKHNPDGSIVFDDNNNPITYTERYLLNANVTEYDTYTFNGIQQVRPKKIYTLKTDAPILSTVIGEENIKTPRSSLFLFSGNNKDKYYKLQSEMVYDNDGNLVQTISNDNINSFINDYSNRYVIASVANANYVDIAYSSFESNGNGQWDFNNSNIISTDQLTGFKAFQLSPGASISRNMRTGEGTPSKYTITYWAKPASGTVSINNQQATEIFSTNYGWSLYKIELSNISTISITGVGIIDELRLYPSGSLMNTVTYQEGIGKVADCDANNRLLFYEYDALGRLKIIRDQNRNIIKTYEYNYKH